MLVAWVCLAVASDAFAQESDARRGIARAGILEARGDFAAAASAYEDALVALPADHALGLQARRSLVELYFDHPEVLGAADALLVHIGALEDAEVVEAAERVNWRLALALQQTIDAEALDLWDQAIQQVCADAASCSYSERLLGRVDQLMAAATDNPNAPLADHLERVLADLLLLSPDTPSMRRIQWRRIAWLESQERWQEAIDAAELDVLLGALADDGPETAIERCIGLMRSAGQSDEPITVWITDLFRNHERVDLAEHALRGIALDRLQRWDTLSPYQSAVLSALAGQQEAALASMAEVLGQTTTSDEAIGRDLGRSAYVLSLLDGHWGGANRLTVWLALPATARQSAQETWGEQSVAGALITRVQDQAESLADTGVRGRLLVLPVRSQVALTRPILQQLQALITQRITDAEQNNLLEAELAWRLATLDLAPRLEQQQALLRDWAAVKQASLGAENAQRWLQALADRLEHPELQQELAYTLAMLLYKQGSLEQAVVAFDGLIGLDVEDHPGRDDWRLARVIALAGLEQWNAAEEAIDALPMNSAGRLLTAGWLAAKANATDQALTRLRQLRDEFPDSPEAGLAVGLLSALEATR
ncbi:MAG: hypothetical protein ACIAXF_05650 [Phycisphaerales bacterium JB063]